MSLAGARWPELSVVCVTGTEIWDEPPKCGKDVNDQLKIRIGLKRKEGFFAVENQYLSDQHKTGTRSSLNSCVWTPLVGFCISAEPDSAAYDKVYLAM